MPLFTRILCPVDFSEPSEAALRVAIAFAQKEGASLHLLHVIEPILIPADYAMGPISPAEFEGQLQAQAEKNLLAAKERAAGAGIQVDMTLRRGKPFHEIALVAGEQHSDLIVIGTHGLSGLSHILMGSTAEKVVRKAPCAVLTIKAPPKAK